ncbi:MAG: cyclase family protein [Chloroflexi bacterium]|nr:cyclase family protein [Chloroflexota bacterium]
MRIIELTMPLYEGMGYSSVYPQEQPFTVEEVYTWDVDGHQREAYTLSSEPGTRFILPSIYVEQRDGPKLDEIDLSKFIMRDMAVVDIPKRAEEPILPEELDKAIAKAEIQPGDAILIRTGWGDNESYLKLGEDFELKSPYYGPGFVTHLIEVLEQYQTDLHCYDVANMHHYSDVKATWCAQKPRPRSWTSLEAKAYVQMEHETRRYAVRSDRRRTSLFAAGITCIGGLTNCGAISRPRVKLIALPLRIKGRTVAACHAVAIEP